MGWSKYIFVETPMRVLGRGCRGSAMVGFGVWVLEVISEVAGRAMRCRKKSLGTCK